MDNFITLEDIKAAKKKLSGVVNETPLEYSYIFSKLTGNEVFFKLENLQKTGAFKIRGAYNKIESLTPEEKKKGVIAASAGNHAQGVAYAAFENGISCTIVMPQGAPINKITNTKEYGAKVVLSGDTYDGAYRKAKEIQDMTGSTFIHAFDDPEVIAGQGTIGLEILNELPNIDLILVPVGGGGLVSGIAIAAKCLNPNVQIIGVEAFGAPAMYLSLKEGKIKSLDAINTIADGIAVKNPGTLTYKIIQKYVDEILTVDDEEIAEAMLALLERSKLVAEASGAVSLAALLSGKLKCKNKRIAAVISGGNVDVNLISLIIEKGLVKTGRLTRLRTLLVDRPGALQKFLSIIATTGANVISVTHDRVHPSIPFKQARVEIQLETRDLEHIETIIKTLEEQGYKLERF